MVKVRIFVGIALVTSLVVAFAPTGGAQPEDKEERTCEVLDGKYENGWSDGVAAPGITVTSFSDESVTFDIADGWTLFGLCVKSGRELNVYNSNVQLPANGPLSVALTKTGPGYGIGHVSFDTDVTPPVTCPTVEAPPVTFAAPAYIDRNRAGGEPVSIVAQDGSINVSAHAGTTHIYKDPNAAPGAADFAVGYFNQTLNWRSTDGGKSWKYVGLAGLENPTTGEGVGPHSATSTGFSDPDYAIDEAGNIYNVEIDLANVAVFKSNDDGQSYATANPEAWFGDRPWLTALEGDEVFLYVNLPKAMLKSVDGGLTWVPVVHNIRQPNGSTQTAAMPPINAKALPDPLNQTNGLIGPEGGNIRGFQRPGDPDFWIGVENDVDVDKPGTPTIAWTKHSTGPLGWTQQFFSSLAADNAGNVYLAAAGGYTGGADATPNGQVSFAYHERATGAKNPGVIEIPTPAGDSLWPWVIAGDEGRAAVVWYQSLAGKPVEFYPYIAVTHNATGTEVTCSDGSKRFIAPQFTVINGSAERPIFVGNICQDGTDCNRNPSFRAGDRRLGDFFTVNFDAQGNLFMITADTMILNPLGGQKPVGNPIFIKQDSGPPMLEAPMETRPTRCLMNLPVC